MQNKLIFSVSTDSSMDSSVQGNNMLSTVFVTLSSFFAGLVFVKLKENFFSEDEEKIDKISKKLDKELEDLEVESKQIAEKAANLKKKLEDQQRILVEIQSVSVKSADTQVVIKKKQTSITSEIKLSEKQSNIGLNPESESENGFGNFFRISDNKKLDQNSLFTGNVINRDENIKAKVDDLEKIDDDLSDQLSELKEGTAQLLADQAAFEKNQLNFHHNVMIKKTLSSSAGFEKVFHQPPTSQIKSLLSKNSIFLDSVYNREVVKITFKNPEDLKEFQEQLLSVGIGHSDPSERGRPRKADYLKDDDTYIISLSSYEYNAITADEYAYAKLVSATEAKAHISSNAFS